MIKIKHIACMVLCLCVLFSGCGEKNAESEDEVLEHSTVSAITDDKIVTKPAIGNGEFTDEMKERFENISPGEMTSRPAIGEGFEGKKPGNRTRPAITGGAFKKPNNMEVPAE